MAIKYEILTQAYVGALADSDPVDMPVYLMEHLTGIYAVPVTSVAEYADNLRQKERELGHVYLSAELAEMLDIEGEGQYDGELAGAWATILRHKVKKETPYYADKEPYYWIINDGKRVTIYAYLIDVLWNLGVTSEPFYIRELRG